MSMFLRCFGHPNQYFLNFFLILSSGRATIILPSTSTTALSGSVNRKVATFFGMIFSHPVYILHLDGVLCFVDNYSLDPCESFVRALYNLNMKPHKFVPEYVLWSDHCSTMSKIPCGSGSTQKNMKFCSCFICAFSFPCLPCLLSQWCLKKSPYWPELP